MTERGGLVQTVRGPVAPEALGLVLPHEHLFVDQVAAVRQPPVEMGARGKWHQPITLANRYDVQANGHLYRDNMMLDDVELAIAEVNLFKRHGGGSLVEVTPHGLGRDPASLLEVSRACDVHVVMGGGYYTGPFHPQALRDASVEEIAELIVTDAAGNETGTILPGIIGEIGTSWPIEPAEERVFRGALLASDRTGLPVTVHPGRHPDAPFALMKIVTDSGADPSKVVMGHIDRTLADPVALGRLADTGCYIELDLFGKEDSYGWPPPEWPNDATRIRMILELVEHGSLRQLLISHDMCTKSRTSRYGGPGLLHIPARTVPLMRAMGMTAADIDTILVENPARMLTIW